MSEVFAEEVIRNNTETNPNSKIAISEYNEEPEDPIKKKERRKRTWQFIIITALVVSSAFLLGGIIAGLACNLECSGYIVAAWLVLIGGWAAVLTGLIFSIRALIKRYFKKNKDKEQALPLSNNKRKNRWKIFWITTKVLVVSAVMIFISFLLYGYFLIS